MGIFHMKCETYIYEIVVYIYEIVVYTCHYKIMEKKPINYGIKKIIFVCVHGQKLKFLRSKFS